MDLKHLTAEELLRLAVPHEDVNPLLAGAPRPGSETWRQVESYAGQLVAGTGRPGSEITLPEEATAEHGPYFYAYVYLAALPYTRAYHREHGVPDEVSWLTLTDLGRHLAVHRRKFGTAGLHAPWWHSLHHRGLLYSLGRLQFERAVMSKTTAEGVRAAGLPYGEGDPVLSVHIPDFMGPMSPEACDASYAWAREFFPAHFPDERHVLAVCYSWLLDRQLAEYLPAESNIVAFQRRFRELYHREDNGLIGFIYGRDLPPEELPRRTALERAVADHLAAGRTWGYAAGFHEI
ncbi:acyltransferase domain-containing protein [Nonomuraea sp. NPDC050310]|uniref:acyltransferase domain-containing protein n=1 Tax=unclassified Nonomuraea TaxID=2593643 RepID=UPI0033EDC170